MGFSPNELQQSKKILGQHFLMELSLATCLKIKQSATRVTFLIGNDKQAFHPTFHISPNQTKDSRKIL